MTGADAFKCALELLVETKVRLVEVERKHALLCGERAKEYLEHDQRLQELHEALKSLDDADGQLEKLTKELKRTRAWARAWKRKAKQMQQSAAAWDEQVRLQRKYIRRRSQNPDWAGGVPVPETRLCHNTTPYPVSK